VRRFHIDLQQKSIYSVSVTWDKQLGAYAHIRDAPPISVSMPVAHGGDGVNPCPVELVVSALGSCLLGTFLVFQKQVRLQVQDIEISAKGNVEKATQGKDEGKYDITGIDVFVNIKVEGDEFDAEIAGDCLRLTKEHCPVTRALQKSFPITIESKIETSR